jgi:hypothetical protein
MPAGPDVGTAPMFDHWWNAPVPKELKGMMPKDPAPCKAAGVRACVEKSTNKGWLMDGHGRTVYGPTPLRHGRAGFETPAAVTTVFLKKPYHWSTMHHADMYYAIFFNGDMAFHIGPMSSGSHGCIRLTPAGAKAFYQHLQIGDRVQVIE